MATIKYWDGSAWQYAVVGKQGPVGATGPTGPAGEASLQRFRFVATGGETSLSGTDANGNTLAYTSGLEEVFLNGAALVRGQDYTATNGTSITGLTALLASDVVEILAWGVFNVSNTISNTLVDAKGDLLVGSAADTVSRLAVGSNNTVLTADSSTATGLKWATPAAGGKVLQVVQASTTSTTVITTTTYTDTGLSVSITPSSTSSKVLIIANQQALITRSSSEVNATGRLLRGATAILTNGSDSFLKTEAQTGGAVTTSISGLHTMIYLDEPATTSSTTYKMQMGTNGTLITQRDSQPSVIIAMEIGA